MNSGSAATYSGLITLGSASSILGGTGTIAISNVGTITGSGFGLTLGGAQGGSVTSIIGTDAGTVTKQDAGNWTLSGASTYTGLTTISAGTLKLGATGGGTNTPLGTIGSGTTVSATGAALDLAGFTLGTAEALTLNGTGVSSGGALMNSGSAATYSGLITLGSASSILGGTGTIAISNVGTITGSGFGLTLGGAQGGSVTSIIGTDAGTVTKQDAGTWTLSGASTYTGLTTISAGTLKLGATGGGTNTPLGTIGAGTTVSATGAALDLAGFTMGTAEALTLNGTGVSSGGALMNSGAACTYSGVITFATAASIVGETGTIAITGTPATATTAITLGGSAGGSVSTVIAGARTLTKAGSGTWTFTNAGNTYSGTTTITTGELRLNPGSTTATFASQVVLNGGTLSTTSIASSTTITSSSTLKLDVSSTIALGSNEHSLKFAHSEGITWAGITLTITGWTGTVGVSGTAGKLFVGTDATGLTSAQLAKISFTGYAAGAQILSTGEVVPAIPCISSTNFYSKATGNLDVLGTWGANTDGTGASPCNFTSNNATYNIRNNATPTLGAAWTVSGTGSKIIVGDGTNACNFTIPASYSLTTTSPAVIDVSSNATLTITHATVPALGTLATTSTVNYASSSTQTITATTYGNLTCSGAGDATFGGTTTVNGDFNMTSACGSVYLNNGATAYNLTVNGNFTIATGSSTKIFYMQATSSGLGATVTVSGSTGTTISGTGTSGSIKMDAGGAGASYVSIFQTTNFSSTKDASGYTVIDFGNYSGVKSNQFRISGNFNHTGQSVFTTYGSYVNGGFFFNGGGSVQTFSYAGTNSDYTSYTINSGAYLQMSTALTLGASSNPASSFTVNGTLDCSTRAPALLGGATNGTFTLASGATLMSANTSGVVSTTVGSISTSINTRTFNAAANYVFYGTANQNTSFPNTTMNNLTINNTGTGGNNTVTLNTAATVSNVLTLTSGILATTGTNLLAITNNLATAVATPSITSYVSGPMKWTLASGTAYTFPVGKGAGTTNYYPFALTPTGSAPIIQVEAFAASCGGTADGTTLSSISTTEYWSASVISGTYTTGVVGLTRQIAIGTMNAIGRNTTTLAGAYSNLNGTVGGTSITGSDVTGSSLGYFVMGVKYSCATPTTDASSLSFGSVTDVSMVPSWTSGNGTSRIVIARQGSAVSFTPTDNTTYSANGNYTSATDLGSGNKCVYNGTSNTFSLTGLTAGTTYYFKVYEYNCTAGTEKYYTAGTPLSGSKPTISTTSTVTAGAGSEPPTFSSLINTQGASVLNFDFLVTDDAGAGGDDANTLISQIVINQGTGNDVANWTQAIAGALLTDGTNTQTASITVNTTNITIASIVSTSGELGYIADNGNKTYTLKIWLNSTMGGTLPATVDGMNLVFGVTNASFTFASGSSLLASSQDQNSGATKNAVAVVATKLIFSTQPSSSGTINTILSVTPIVSATDANNNVDLGFSGTIGFTNSGGLGMSGSSAAASSGVASFSSLLFTQIGGPVTLTTTNTATLTNATSVGITIVSDAPVTEGINISGNIVSNGTINQTNDENYITMTSATGTITGSGIYTQDKLNVAGTITFDAVISSGSFLKTYVNTSKSFTILSTRTYLNGLFNNYGTTTLQNTANWENTGNWLNFNGVSGIAANAGSNLKFNGTLTQSVKCDGAQLGNVEIANSSTPDASTGVTLVDAMNVGSSSVLTLTDGLVITNGSLLIVNNTSSTALIAGAGNTGYVNSWVYGTSNSGSLRRGFAENNAQDYVFPVGSVLRSHMAVLTNHNLPNGALTIDCWFNAGANFTGTLPTLSELGTTYTGVKTDGVWVLNKTGDIDGTYDLKLYLHGVFSGMTNYQFNILSRSDGGTNTDWALSSGTPQPTTVASDYVYRKGMNTFSEKGVAEANNTFPVELISNYVTCLGNAVQMSWTTASETNNDYFSIDKTKDLSNWYDVGTVSGSGTTNTVHLYNLTDNTPFSGKSYYRLKQVDFDGASKTYDPVSTECIDVEANTFEIINIVPNESHDGLAITYNVPEVGKVDLYVIDNLGQRLTNTRNNSTKGLNMVTMSLRHPLAIGIYMIAIECNEKVFTQKVFIK